MMEFIKIAQSTSISEAAKALYCSHQTLSKHLKEMEAEVGCPLVRRTTPLRLTVFGESFLHSSIAIVNEYESMLSHVAQSKSEVSGTVSVLMYDFIPFSDVLSSVILSMKEQFPGISIDFKNTTRCTSEQALLEGEIDVGYWLDIRDEKDSVDEILDARFDYVLLTPIIDELFFGVSRDHPLAKRESEGASLKEINSYPILVPTFNSDSILPLAVKNMLQSYGFSAHFEPIAAESMDEFHMKMSAEGVYLLSTKYYAYMSMPKIFSDNIVKIRVPGKTFRISAYCMTLKEKNNKALNCFVGELEKVCAG